MRILPVFSAFLAFGWMLAAVRPAYPENHSVAAPACEIPASFASIEIADQGVKAVSVSVSCTQAATDLAGMDRVLEYYEEQLDKAPSDRRPQEVHFKSMIDVTNKIIGLGCPDARIRSNAYLNRSRSQSVITDRWRGWGKAKGDLAKEAFRSLQSSIKEDPANPAAWKKYGISLVKMSQAGWINRKFIQGNFGIDIKNQLDTVIVAFQNLGLTGSEAALFASIQAASAKL